MELIPNMTSRTATFHRRKKSLFKKALELTTLCDIPACIIVCGPADFQPETWPHNSEEVRRVIHMYKTKQLSRRKNHDLHHYYKTENNKVENRIARKRSRVQNDEASRHLIMWNDRIKNLSLDQSKEFLGLLDRDIEDLETRIDSIKNNIGLELVEEEAAGATTEMIDWSKSNMKMESISQAQIHDSVMLPPDPTSGPSPLVMFLNDSNGDGNASLLGGLPYSNFGCTPPLMAPFYADVMLEDQMKIGSPSMMPCYNYNPVMQPMFPYMQYPYDFSCQRF